MAKKKIDTISEKETSKQKNKERNVVVGKRLQELMTLKGVKNAELSRALEHRYNDVLALSNLCNYIKGVVPIASQKIERICDILGVDEGYLKGKDKFACETYSEYCEWAELFEKNNVDFVKYDLLLKPAKCFLMSEMNPDDEQIEYRVNYDTETKTFTAQDMENFYQRVIDFIQSEFKRYISADYTPTNLEEWVSFLKCHPDYLDENPDLLNGSETNLIIKALSKGGVSGK